MRKFSHKPDHRGSTLLMVMICLAFLAILGSLMLSVSLLNLQMKRVESRSKNNFYYCESALEDIRAGLEELTATQIQSTYSEILTDYAMYEAKSVADRNIEIQGMVMDKLSDIFDKDNDGNLDSSNDLSDVAKAFKDYLSLTKENVTLTKDNFIISVDQMIQDKGNVPNSLSFKTVHITYVENGYATSISSDIIIKLPSFTLSNGSETVSYSMQQPFAGYALVADGEIRSENSGGINRIKGNVYAGDGIIVKDENLTHSHQVFLDGNYITTRGDITVADTAWLTIGDNIQPILFADNMKTVTTGKYPADFTSKTNLKVNARCMIKDDLTLDGRNSEAVFKGAYVGYTGGNTAKSSAIMVNGSGSSLNLSGLTSLVLAGRAHISVEDDILKNGNVPDPNINIMTGESLAFKSNQLAYLVPGEYINLVSGAVSRAAMHNPITEADLKLGSPDVSIPDLTGDTTVKFNYFQYINASPQYKLAAKQTANGGAERYYYLNFSNGKMADQFLKDYWNKYPDVFKNTDRFVIGSVQLPFDPADIVSVGNVMYYDSSVQLMNGLSGSKADDSTLNSYIADMTFAGMNNNSAYSGTILSDKKISELSGVNGLFFNMTHYLAPEAPAAGSPVLKEADEAVASTVLKSKITQVISQYGPGGYVPKNTGFFYDTTGSSLSSSSEDIKNITVINGNAVITNCFSGFLIASGDVTIEAGAKINGIIIAAGGASGKGDVKVMNGATVHGRLVAAGDIILNENCTVDCTGVTSFDSATSTEVFLEDLFKNDGQLLWNFFTNPKVTINISKNGTPADFTDIEHLVTCENWRKN